MSDEPKRIYLRTCLETRCGQEYVRIWDMSLEPKDGLVCYELATASEHDPWELLRDIVQRVTRGFRCDTPGAEQFDRQINKCRWLIKLHDERTGK